MYETNIKEDVNEIRKMAEEAIFDIYNLKDTINDLMDYYTAIGDVYEEETKEEFSDCFEKSTYKDICKLEDILNTLEKIKFNTDV